MSLPAIAASLYLFLRMPVPLVRPINRAEREGSHYKPEGDEKSAKYSKNQSATEFKVRFCKERDIVSVKGGR